MKKIISRYGPAYLVKDISLKNIDAPFYKWLREEGFINAWHKGHYEVCDWCFINADAKLFAYGMPGIEIAKPINERPISIEEFMNIYSRKPVRDSSWVMTYNDYRNMFDTVEEFEKYFRMLSEDEVRELIVNEKAGATVKACIFQKWRSLSGS